MPSAALGVQRVTEQGLWAGPHLSRRGLQRVVLQQKHLQLLHLSEADGDHQNFVAGKVKLHQGKIY